MTSFDLVTQPWVPVLRAGRPERVSLQQAFAEAHELDGLGLDDPHQAVAVLRQVLLPVLLHACGAPRSTEEWGDRWDAATLPLGDVTTYLDTYRHRFDLFDATAPFGQVAGLHTAKNETKPISLLIPRLASGNNVPLFSARTEANPPALDPADAVLALLAAQCWDTAAIKSGAVGDPKTSAGKTTGNPTGPLGQLGVVVPWGRTLKETLLLNCLALPAGLRSTDAPPWAREPVTAQWAGADEGRLPRGPIELMTWQSRRIRLVAEVGGAPTSKAGDDRPVLISRVVVCAGDRLAPTASSLAPRPDLEWHTAWKATGEKQSDLATQRPVRHEPGRAAWRGLEALLATRSDVEELTAPTLLRQIADLRAQDWLPVDYPLQTLTVGVRYGNQSAVVEDAMSDLIPLPLLALTTDTDVRAVLLELVDQADQLRRSVNRLADDLRLASGAEKVAWDKSQHPGDLVIHRLDGVVRRILLLLQTDPTAVDRLRPVWSQLARREVWVVADGLLATAPDSSFLGRTDPRDRDRPRPRVINAATSRGRLAYSVTNTLGSVGDSSTAQAERIST